MTTGRVFIIAALVVLSALALPAGPASAQECRLDPAALDPLVEVYNRNVDQVPGIARGQLSGQQVDLRVETPDGDRQFAVATADDGRITSFEDGAAADPTLRVETSESALCEVVAAEDPAAAFADAYDSGSIDVSGVGVVKGVVVGAVKVGVGIAKWLSGLF